MPPAPDFTLYPTFTMDRSHKVIYRAGLLQPKSLTTMTKIQIALTEFAAVLNRENHAILLQDSLGKPYIIELVLSGISKKTRLNDWILEHFPSEPKSFEDSFSGKLLGQLANFFLLYSPSVGRKAASSLRDYHRTVKLAREVIRILLTVTFLEENRPQGDIGRAALLASKNVKAKGSQKEKERVLLGIQRSDKVPFADLQLQEPKNRVEADKLCKKLLILMRDILGEYLKCIRSVEVAEFIKSMVIRQTGPEAIVVTEPQTTEDVQCPAAFPTFLPMKVAFHFDTPDDFGKWQILLGSQAQTDLRAFQQRNRKIYAAIMTKMKELSKGIFSPNNQRHLTGSDTDVSIFEAEVPESEELRIVYCVDCIGDYDNHSEVQALRIFGVFPLGQIDHSLWKSVSRFLTSQGEGYQGRCLVRKLEADSGDSDTYLPRSFSNSIGIDELSASEPIDYLSNLPPDDANQLHHIISLEKYVILSKALLESIDTNRIANFPFEVSKHERHIIQHHLSCYVLGRSGTGKTTTMLFKMLLIERTYQLSDGSQPRPRQMFVTKSRVLAGKVDEHFKTFLMSLSFPSDIEQPFPSKNDPADEENIVDEEDNTKWRNDLPQKFTELEDQHFPLFITFDHLCKMIDADIQDSESVRHRSPITASLAKGKARSLTTMRQLVNFDRFLAAYWVHFSQWLTKNFGPLPVFNEIMGVISGSEETLQFPKGYLDRQAYLELSSRTHPTFANYRSELYDLFEAYLKRKQELQDFDVAGRTHAIIHFVDRELSNVQKLSHLYVDETQDNLLIDTYLLRLLCRNTDGLFWAGDTAQTISAGSSFSFNTLKAFQHRVQINLFEERMSNIRVKEPKMFYLSVNYRSHAGIVNCAHSIIDVLQRFWQDSIDSLPRERGNAPGAKPIFYTDLSPEFIRGCRFLSRNSNSVAEEIELGAHQCILVRDEKARAKLSSEVNHEIRRNISTLYDTKGLEFNDVILYNFFQDSPVEEPQWRLVLREVFSTTKGSTPFRVPEYDHNRHATLCSELKGLYVAVTRARNNLRIIDESEKGEPMRALWESRDQIISCKPGEEPTDFAKPSSAGEWAQRARMYFDNQNWFQASQCFEKANKKKAAAIANAYHLRQIARRMPMQSMDSASAFASAGKAFEECAEDTSKIDHKNSYLKIGAQCYHDGGHILRAAEIYRQGGWILEAVTNFHELRRFNDIFAILTQPQPPAPSTIPASIRDETRLHYISKNDYRKSCRLFTSDEEQLQYLAGQNLDNARADLLLYLGRMEEGVEFLLSKSKTIDAIDLCLRNEKDKGTSAKRAKGILFESLWHLSPFGTSPIDRKKTDKLLSCSNRISLDENEMEEIKMFRTIASGPHTELVQLASSFMNMGNLEAAALCFDHYFNRFPQLIQSEQDIKKIADYLKQFSDYVGILRDLAFLEDPVNDSRACKLFGIQAGEKCGTIVLSRQGLLYNHVCNKRPTLTIPTKGKVVLRNEEFIKVFHECLQARLLDRVTTENDGFLNAPALRDPPCLRHLLYADCDSSTCSLLHVSPDMAWSENWVNAHLLQIVIHQSISCIQDGPRMKNQRRYWLMKLYEALIPSSHLFGSTFTINDVTTFFPKAMSTVLEWARAMTLDLPFLPRYMFLTFAMQIADFAFAFDEGHPELYIDRPPFTVSPCPLLYSNGLNGNNVVQEMLKGLYLGGPSSLIMGISFIRHVVERRIPINIHVFCSFIERICALLIVCNRLQQLGNLHSVMLPRSWLQRVLDRLDVEEAKVQGCRFRRLLQPVGRLIHALHPSAPPDIRATSQFKVGPKFRDFESQGSSTQAVFVARLCRVVGLLGCNVHVKQFRSDILTIFTSIHRKSTLELAPLYARYFNAKNFDDIHRATSQSMRGGVFDEMTKLLHTNSTHPVLEFLPVRNLVYSTSDELLLLLQVGPSGSSNDVTASAQSEDKPAPLEYEPGLEQEDDLEHDIDTGRPPQPTSVADHQRHGQDIVLSTELPEEVMPIFGDQETRAAYIIQGAFRSLLARRRNVINDDRQGDETHEWFVRYKETLQSDMQSLAPGSSVRYSIVYLGPLPELLAALKAIWNLLGKKKRWLRKRLTQISGNEQDKFNAALTGINKATKTLKRLQQHIEPGSALHSERNMGRLTKKVKEVFDFIETIQPLIQIPEDLRGCLDRVHKAVLREKSLPPQGIHQSQRGRRPPLVMEDNHDLVQEAYKDPSEYK